MGKMINCHGIRSSLASPLPQQPQGVSFRKGDLAIQHG